MEGDGRWSMMVAVGGIWWSKVVFAAGGSCEIILVADYFGIDRTFIMSPSPLYIISNIYRYI